MKDFIKEIIPYEIVNRGKQGFEPPLQKWISTKKYSIQMRDGLKILIENGILNEKWKDFYINNIFKGNNPSFKENSPIFNVYKIRLFLFITRYNKWIEKTS